MTSVKEKHPEITPERLAEWRLVADAFDGESAIKRAGETYLPRPSGFAGTADPDAAYSGYKNRAQFPEIFAPTVGAMVGIVHSQDAQIEMPDALAFIWERATADGQTLEAFHRTITRNLLTFGRYGILTDAPSDGGEPYFVGYSADAVINWDADFWVLDETHLARDGFRWDTREQYRVLELVEGRYVQSVYGETDLREVIEATGTGGRALDFIPFAIANSRDLLPSVSAPPLIGVARSAKAIYQLSADKRHQLYMSGQETLVAINGEAPEYVGAGVVHEMHGSDTQQPDLKYVAPSCSGIEAHERAIRDEREAAVMAGARMLEQSEGIEESGAARKLRFASETANLLSVALVSHGLLEKSLRHAARIMGLDEKQVVVTPPADLMDHSLTPAEAEALVRVWQSGGMSYQTLYERLQRGGIVSAERDHAEEFALLDQEEFRGADSAP